MVLPIMSEAMTGMRQLQGRVSLWLLRLSSKLEQIQADTKSSRLIASFCYLVKTIYSFYQRPSFPFGPE